MQVLLGQLPDTKLHGVFYADVALATIGLVVLCLELYRSPLFRRGGEMRFARARPNHLRLDHILLPMLAYFSCGPLTAALLTRWQPQLAEETVALVANSAGQLCGGLACLLLAGVTFDRSFRGFLSGDRGPGRPVWVGLLGLAAVFPVCWGLYELSKLVLRWLAPQIEFPLHVVLEMISDPQLPGWTLVLLWVSAVGVAPFAEEVFFRGICQSALNNVFRRPLFSMAVTAVIFGLSHVSQPQAIAPLIALGLALAYVYERTGAVIGPMTLHAAFNLKNMIFFSLVPQPA